MSKDLPQNPEPGGSPERRLIDAALQQELGPRAEPAPSPPAFGQAGSLLASPDDIPGYEIIREIHRGGQGVVYQAVQKATKRTVAIKVIREGPFAGAADKARFEREVQILAALNHPNIVTIHDSGEARGSFYYVMTYVPGESLDTYLSHSARTPEEALRLFAGICEAVNAAHLQGVIHRDLKPGNIRVDPTGQPHILDFGLARRSLGTSAGDFPQQTMTVTGQFVGSLPWASPEQAQGLPGKIDIRTDVYSLGVILYQMLTGRFPYAVVGNMRDVLDNILKAEPARPSTIRRQINDEVETIVLKCLAKERERRYQTAGELARDIGRYLNREPIEAKRDSALYMLKKAVHQHKAPVALATAVALLVAGSALALLVMYQRQGELLVQRHRQEQATRRENLVQKLRIICDGAHWAGWSDRAWQVAREIQELGADSVARDHAAATLVDIDAHPIPVDPVVGTLGASALAFDRSGGRLLLGGIEKQDGKLRKLDAGTCVDSGLKGEGPVTFRPDGTPLQLVADDNALRLWNMETRRPVHELRFPVPLEASSPAKPTIRAAALAADGSRAAAVCQWPDRNSLLLVWDCSSGQVCHRLAAQATTLAFTPDGALLAAGDTRGEIAVWSLTQERRLTVLPAQQATVNCLAFGRDPTASSSGDGESIADGWLLAAGYGGASVLVWDPAKGVPRAYCRGALWDVYTLDMSPDGALVAAAGHSNVELWDTATGQMLLRLSAPNQGGAVCFSTDGGMLAASGSKPPWLRLWRLDHQRGIRVLRGLTAPPSRLCLSPDGRLAAAVAHNWKVAVWDIHADAGLLHVFDAPQGLFADNTAVAFSPDGRQLAFSTWNAARLWDVDSGRILKEWRLPKGLDDLLAFTPDGTLLSFRVETRDGTNPPTSEVPPDKYPRVCRIRELLRKTPDMTTIKEIDDFNWGISFVAAPSNGRFFAVEGQGGPNGHQRMIKVFDAQGKEIYSTPSTKPRTLSGRLACDSAGRFLAAETAEASRATLLEIPGFKPLGVLGHTFGLNPNAIYWAGHAEFYATDAKFIPDEIGLALHAVGRDDRPLAIFKMFSCEAAIFSSDGKSLAWTSGDGVRVCNLPQVRQRLAQLGLNWQD